MKDYVLTGRTIGATYYDTYEEAWEDYLNIDPTIIASDGEIEIYKWDGNDCVDARRRGMPQWVKELKARVEKRKREREQSNE